MKWTLLPLLLMTLPLSSYASTEAAPVNLLSGNAIISPAALQRVVKQVVVQNLQKNIDASNSLHGISINSDSSEHSITIPESPMLNQILDTLGIKNNVTISVSPIETSINFGPESLKIKIIKKDTNLFKLVAHWEISQLKARCHALKIHVPKGAFDRAFTITSSPIKIGLKPKSGPLTADLSILVKITDEGSKFTIGAFKTNLDDNSNKLQLQLGKLSVNGSPLELEIISNGKSIKTDELTVRKEFQRFEPQLMKIIEKKLSETIHSEFESLSDKLAAIEPVKVAFKTSDILDSYSLNNDVVRTVLRDISGEFMLNSFQDLPNQNLYSTRIASNICVGQSCLINMVNPSAISTVDTASMGTDEAGMILYESWLQNIINSDEFQSRVHSYYHQSIKSPGVEINSNGVKVHFNPSMNSIAAVLNLRIDIKATVDSSKAFNSWGNFFDFVKKQGADVWENIAGSGEYVYVPVEINFVIAQTTTFNQGKPQLKVIPKFPFHSDGTVTNNFRYYSNLSSMNATIRKELMKCVESEITKSIPKEMIIELSKPINLGGNNFYINRVLVTKNKGLLVSGDIE